MVRRKQSGQAQSPTGAHRAKRVSRNEGGSKLPHSRDDGVFSKGSYETNSAAETHRLGIRIGKTLRIPCVVLLRGPLGVGKTTLTRGVAEGLGLEDLSRVSSPSFSLVNIYHGRCPIYHVDLYRLEGTRDLYTTGLDEFLGREGVTIVEWSERLTFPVESAVVIDIADAGDDSRIFAISESESKWPKPGHTSRRNGKRSGRR